MKFGPTRSSKRIIWIRTSHCCDRSWASATGRANSSKQCADTAFDSFPKCGRSKQRRHTESRAGKSHLRNRPLYASVNHDEEPYWLNRRGEQDFSFLPSSPCRPPPALSEFIFGDDRQLTRRQ